VISQTEDRVLYRLVEISLGWLAVGAGRSGSVWATRLVVHSKRLT